MSMAVLQSWVLLLHGSNQWCGVLLVFDMLFMSMASSLIWWFHLGVLDKGSNLPLFVPVMYWRYVMFTTAKGGPWWALWYQEWSTRSSYFTSSICIWQCLLYKEWQKVRGDSEEYTRDILCRCSGQKINLDKSSVFFGNHCKENIKNKVKGILGVQSEILNEK
jgi:hypothetical protein